VREGGHCREEGGRGVTVGKEVRVVFLARLCEPSNALLLGDILCSWTKYSFFFWRGGELEYRGFNHRFFYEPGSNYNVYNQHHAG